ncbi:MAG: protein translocase subunit SecD [Propionibacteriaceae bacterium]|nr:protein translocase subunit SecD [Propionibacteriaceae bacterium]
MATTSRKHSHPLRTLVILALVTTGLYSLIAFSGVWTPKLGLDLRGGTTITLTASNTSGTGAVDPTSLELARSIIQQRVDSLGVGETEVTTSGDRQIVVSVPNVQRDELLKLVGSTAQLYFRKVYAAEANPGSVPTTEPSATASSQPSATVSSQPSATVSADPTPTSTTNKRPLPSLPTPVPSPRPTVPSGTVTPLTDLLKWTPTDRDNTDFTNFKCGDPFPDVSDQPLIACDQTQSYKYLLGPALIKGESVTNAQAAVPQNSVSYVVQLQFDNQGGADFQAVTAHLSAQSSPQNQFGIVLDGVIISAPSVDSTYSAGIPGGRAEISGSFTQKSASELANVLKYGALPLAFEVSSVDNVSAKLGGDQLQAGLLAGLIGLGLVLAYSILYYRGLALVVSLSLVVAGALTWALIVLLGQSMGFALNLPGIAGVIVAIGVTADSFIIYFERIRDEVREGRSLRTAIETGWVRSRKTILAADSVSLLSAVVLFVLAIGAVKGFAFTLGLTTLIDIAVVFFFTKPLMTLLGRTKFFGEGHKFSGFEAEHMGSQIAPLHNSRRKGAVAAGGEA